MTRKQTPVQKSAPKTALKPKPSPALKAAPTKSGVFPVPAQSTKPAPTAAKKAPAKTVRKRSAKKIVSIKDTRHRDSQQSPGGTPNQVNPESDSKRLKPLSAKEELFVAEYMKDFNGTRAYRVVNPASSARAANANAVRLIARDSVTAAIAAAKENRVQRLGFDADRIAQEVYHIATADARELVDFVVSCCHHCHGPDFKYLFTPAELDRAKTRHEHNENQAEAVAAMKKKPYVRQKFDPKGGVGYDARKPPNPDCPECFGRGKGEVILKDTRSLSPAGVSIFAGAEWGKDGPKVNMHSKTAALDMSAKHIGFYEADNAQQAVTFANAGLLDAIYAKKMQDRAAREARTKGRSARIEKANETS